jgi:hypothetical protein
LPGLEFDAGGLDPGGVVVAEVPLDDGFASEQDDPAHGGVHGRSGGGPGRAKGEATARRHNLRGVSQR